MAGLSSEIEIAWAAGLFEGEGCFTAQGQARGKYYGVAKLSMVDAQIVERFAAIVQVGHLTWRPASPGRQRQRVWTAASFEDFQAVAHLLWPHLSTRRRVRAGQILRHDSRKERMEF
jgi:hypothetical protein